MPPRRSERLQQRRQPVTSMGQRTVFSSCRAETTTDFPPSLKTMLDLKSTNCRQHPKEYNIFELFRCFAQNVQASTLNAPDEFSQFKQCYTNATQYVLHHPGFDYVEGYYIHPQIGFPFEHAWVYHRATGRHYDCTVKDPETYQYFGLIIPSDVLLDIAVGDEYRGNVLDTLCRAGCNDAFKARMILIREANTT